jgi:hypothetical protein
MPRLAAALPKDPTKNGLAAIASELLLDPLKRHLVVAVVDCSKITTDTGTGDCEATVRVLRIEQVHPDDRAQAERLVRRALEYRSREQVLPIDLERDLEEWFGKDVTVDMATGLVTVPSDGLTDELVTNHDDAPFEGGDDDDDAA